MHAKQAGTLTLTLALKPVPFHASIAEALSIQTAPSSVLTAGGAWARLSCRYTV